MKTLPRECEQCGLKFDVEPYKVLRGGGRFCSKKCQGTAVLCGPGGPFNGRRPAWTHADDAALKELFSILSDTALALLLGRSPKAIRTRAQQKSLCRELLVCQALPKLNRWRPEEDAALREMHPHTSNVHIAEWLGRSKTAVNQRVSALGLKRARTYYLARPSIAFSAYPKELQEAIVLSNKIRRRLREREDASNTA